jgi:DNA-binding transcriptional MerR regulator
MSGTRLYVDEDASEHAVVLGLRARGVELQTTAEADRLGSSDSDQLAYAAEQRRAIYTFNAGDFARLHREYLEQGRQHHGIIVIPDQRYSVGEKIRRLAKFLNAVTAEALVNRMEYL